MTAYELMIKTNHYLLGGGVLTEAQRQNIVGQLLPARSTHEQARRFYQGVRLPGNIDGDGRRMYPVFFIPPYHDGKKYPTVTGVTPKTHILSANAYELEILRLLCLFDPDDPDVAEMIDYTLARLKTTCFGNMDDGVGECFDASLIVLRFLVAAAPGETRWIMDRIDSFNRHFTKKRRPRGVLWYFYLCLSELPDPVAAPEILKHHEALVRQYENISRLKPPQIIKTILGRVLTKIPA
jgi:hypothetical protein